MQIDYHQLDAALRAISTEFPFTRDMVYHLIRHKGLPGFVQEFKTLKAWALQLLSGKPNYKEEWFRTICYQGYTIPAKYDRLFIPLVNIIRVVELRPNKAHLFQRDVQLILSVFNIYQTVRGPYRPDMLKQVRAATQSEVTPVKHSFWEAGLELACHAIPWFLPSNLGKLRPTGQSLSLKPGQNGTWGQFVAQNAFTLLAGPDHQLTMRKLERRLKSLEPSSHMGNLTFLGEPGGKTRTILVADPILQSQLSVLKDSLLNVLRFIPTDCLWDQQRGVDFLKHALDRCETVYSVDLKDATWNFPRRLQEVVLRKLGVKRKVRDLIFRTLVYNPLDKKSYPVEKGQAMGLGPSFPLFSLTHNLLLLFLCKWLGINPIDSYRILGDDVIIVNEGLYHAYTKCMNEYEIPISTTKSFISSRLGEFAGQVLWYGCNITPIRWKWLDWNSLSTLYWRYRNLSKRISREMLRSKKAAICLSVLGPLPKWVGGLNLRESDLPKANHSVNKLRCGILESFREGLMVNNGSSGETKISNFLNPLEVGVFEPLVDPEALRCLDSLLVNDSLTELGWGDLPLLCPKPYKFLNQVGISMNLMPVREIFSLEKGYKMRFKKSKNQDYKQLIRQLSTEVSFENKTQSPVIAEEDQAIISTFFGKPTKQ